VAYVRTLVGDLHLSAGDLDLAQASYRRTLADAPSYGMAEFGLARVAAARGDFDGAARVLSPLVARLPFSAWVAFSGDVDAALGQQADAVRQCALVRTIEHLNRANGVARGPERGRFASAPARGPG